MGCIVSKQGTVVEAKPMRAENQQEPFKDNDRNGKSSVTFDIDLHTWEPVGDSKGDHSKQPKIEPRIPAVSVLQYYSLKTVH